MYADVFIIIYVLFLFHFVFQVCCFCFFLITSYLFLFPIFALASLSDSLPYDIFLFGFMSYTLCFILSLPFPISGMGQKEGEFSTVR